MNGFRLLLIAILVTVVAYTTLVVAEHGLGLLPIFFGDIAKMTWPGQFNLDFLGLLILSGSWVAWRHHFSAVGLVLGVVAFFFGAPFLTLYLLTQSFRCHGDVKAMLLGEQRARG